MLLGAEFMLFIGSIFRLFSYWGYSDPKPERPIHFVSELRPLLNGEYDRPISIAIFIASHNESKELLSYTISDVNNLYYPYPDIKINAYLLDDGQRPELKSFCEENNITYIGKKDNKGYKASNLNNAFEQTEEDLIVILDADTRPFENFLAHTTGYFKDQKTGWVQTPQWYYDLSTPILPSNYGKILLGKTGWLLGKLLDIITFKKLYVNKDIYASNPMFFYDAILRNRNPYNGVFSCGAGSIYRRDALNEFKKVSPENGTPFKHHISEDLYTSMIMHDVTVYKSIYHRHYECKMLSPQDTDSWIKQQTRYASGAIDIGTKRSPLRKNGLTLIQKLLYYSVFYCYFTPLLSYLFFSVPVIYFLFEISSIPGFNVDFLCYFGLFQFLNLSVFVIANWGISTKRPDQKFWSSFTYVTKSWIEVLSGKKLNYSVTPKEQKDSNGFIKTLPHLIIILIMIGSPLYYYFTNHQSPFTMQDYFYLLWCIYFIYQLNQFIRMWLWDMVKSKKT